MILFNHLIRHGFAVTAPSRGEGLMGFCITKNSTVHTVLFFISYGFSRFKRSLASSTVSPSLVKYKSTNLSSTFL